MDEIKKYAHVEKQAISEGELALINKQTLRPLTAEEVFSFKVAACDNQIDRDLERFSDAALAGFATLFVGKTIISDHKWSAEKQAARIYAADVEAEGDVKTLVLRAYMLRNQQTAPTIAAIEGGILREVSVGCAVERVLCSVCDSDQAKAFCGHRPGKEYDGEVCVMTLDGARDAFEVSFVAVPAQPGAGVIKRYGGEGEPQEGAPGHDPGAEEELLRMATALQEQEEKRYGGMLV